MCFRSFMQEKIHDIQFDQLKELSQLCFGMEIVGTEDTSALVPKCPRNLGIKL